MLSQLTSFPPAPPTLPPSPPSLHWPPSSHAACFINSLLIVATCEPTVLISLLSSKLLLVISIYHKNSKLILSQMEHTAFPVSSSLILVVSLFFLIIEHGTTNQAKIWKFSLIFSPPLTVLPQALVKSVLLILPHLAISSFAVG